MAPPERSAWTRRWTRLGWWRRGGTWSRYGARSIGRSPRTRDKENAMKRSWTLTIATALITVGIVVGLAAAPLDAQSKNVLVAKKVAAAPALDGTLDAAWNGAQPLAVKAIGG